MDAAQLAIAHYRQQVALARRIARETDALWLTMNAARLDASWAGITDQLLALVTGGQYLAASTADPYTAATLAAQQIDPAAAGALNPRAFAGIASDGRPLQSLLYEPVIRTKTVIGGGGSTARAMTAGRLSLDQIVRTQIADAGRVSAGTSLAARPAATGYVRMVVGKTCSRCIVLAGKPYRWNAGFKRHPRCDCIHIPTRENLAGALVTDPKQVFGSMTLAEQDKAFGKAGAQAIREGADIGQVVNARRGMTAAGTTRTGLNADGQVVNLQRRTLSGGTTSESTSRRGVAPGHARLMPEAIYRQAAGNRDEAIRLLRSNGYLVGAPVARPVARTVVRDAAALKAVPSSVTRGANRRPAGMSDTDWRQAQAALREYRGIGFTGVNSQLRNPVLQLEHVTTRIERMDRVMAASALTADVAVYRGVADVGKVFGSAASGSLVGARWTEAAYMSTSTRLQQARSFAAPGESRAAVMEIRVRRGTHAVQLSSYGDQAEILLQRGLRPRIVEDRGIINGMRYLVVEIP